MGQKEGRKYQFGDGVQRATTMVGDEPMTIIS